MTSPQKNQQQQQPQRYRRYLTRTGHCVVTAVYGPQKIFVQSEADVDKFDKFKILLRLALDKSKRYVKFDWTKVCHERIYPKNQSEAADEFSNSSTGGTDRDLIMDEIFLYENPKNSYDVRRAEIVVLQIRDAHPSDADDQKPPPTVDDECFVQFLDFGEISRVSLKNLHKISPFDHNAIFNEPPFAYECELDMPDPNVLGDDNELLLKYLMQELVEGKRFAFTVIRPDPLPGGENKDKRNMQISQQPTSSNVISDPKNSQQVPPVFQWTFENGQPLVPRNFAHASLTLTPPNNDDYSDPTPNNVYSAPAPNNDYSDPTPNNSDTIVYTLNLYLNGITNNLAEILTSLISDALTAAEEEQLEQRWNPDEPEPERDEDIVEPERKDVSDPESYDNVESGWYDPTDYASPNPYKQNKSEEEDFDFIECHEVLQMINYKDLGDSVGLKNESKYILNRFLTEQSRLRQKANRFSSSSDNTEVPSNEDKPTTSQAKAGTSKLPNFQQSPPPPYGRLAEPIVDRIRECKRFLQRKRLTRFNALTCGFYNTTDDSNDDSEEDRDEAATDLYNYQMFEDSEWLAQNEFDPDQKFQPPQTITEYGPIKHGTRFYIVYVEDPSEFYVRTVQQVEDARSIKEILLGWSYLRPFPLLAERKESTWRKKQACVVKYDSNAIWPKKSRKSNLQTMEWYRGKICGFLNDDDQKGMIQILLIDVGLKIYCSRDELYVCPRDVCFIPPLCYKVGLDGKLLDLCVKYSEEIIDYFRMLVEPYKRPKPDEPVLTNLRSYRCDFMSYAPRVRVLVHDGLSTINDKVDQKVYEKLYLPIKKPVKSG